MLGWARCRVLVAAGELRQARELADQGYRAAVAERSPWLTGAWAGFRRMVALVQGQVATARASLTEALALLGEHDPYRFARLWHGELACAAALAGDPAGAARWVAEMDRRADEANRLFEARLELDRAWVAAGSGELTRALTLAGRAAELARAREQRTVEVTALYDIARLGRPELVTDRLATLAASIEGRFAATAAASAAALAASDGVALDEAAATFEELGALLLAAEAAVAAAGCHQRAGRQASAKAAVVRAGALAAACEGARTPALQAGRLRSLLTGQGAGGCRTRRRRRAQPPDRRAPRAVGADRRQLPRPSVRQARDLRPHGARDHAQPGRWCHREACSVVRRRPARLREHDRVGVGDVAGQHDPGAAALPLAQDE
jgi:hypothetical protein